jgi:serine/threonine protein kinase
MADQVGQQFGAYQLTSLLARHSSAEVYHGEQRYSHIDVAIKLLRRPLADTEAVDAFRSEARTLAGLIHPHIVRVLSFDVQQQTGYLVMEYAPGGTLRQHHASGTRLELEALLLLFRPIAEALNYAHEQGVIHQALKPEHVLIGHQEEILIAGFALASAYQPAEGQPPIDVNDLSAYLAPEQLQGKPVPASDQYALGVMVYEWLSGALPFQGAGAELAQQILKAAPPLLHETIAISLPVERVVMRAMSKDPTKRFASMQAFAAALEEAALAAPQPAATGAAAKPSAPAARPATAQPARGSARTAQSGPSQQPAAERFVPPQAPNQGQPMRDWRNQPNPYQKSAQQPAYHRPAQQPTWQQQSTPKQTTNTNMIGCIIVVVIVAFIGLIILLSNQ